MRRCSKCGEDKPESEFYKHKGMKDGLRPNCKSCSYVTWRKYYESHKDELLQYYKRYREDNPNYHSPSVQRYNKNNPEKRRANVKLNHAVEQGLMRKPSVCAVCGVEHAIIHGHHEDYSKPLEVIWVCPKCHKQIHADKAKQAAEAVA